MIWETYLAFGDSITIGARTYLGYPEAAGSLLHEATGREWNIVNIAVSGFTTIELARHIDLQHTISFHKAGIATILIGTNDAKLNTSPEDFEIAYRLLLTKIKLCVTTGNIKLILIPPFYPGVMYPYNVEMNNTIEAYNSIIKDLGKKFSFDILDLNLSETHFIDGVHLNKEGVWQAAKTITKCILTDRGM